MKEIQEQLVAGFPGSFDPFHDGHKFTMVSFFKLHPKATLYIVVGVNEEKEGFYTFSTEEKVFLIERSIPAEYAERVKVIPYSGIIANLFYEQNINMFVKGARDSKDFESESWIAEVNSKFAGNPTTLIIPQTNPVLSKVSSSNLKNFINFGLDAKDFAPALIREALQMRMKDQLMIGVTGGIASGKTTLAEDLQRFSEENSAPKDTSIYHISLDALGKVVYSNDPTPRFLAIRKQINKEFGGKLLKEDDSIDTRKLGNIAFSSKRELDKLVGIMLDPILHLLRKKLDELGKGIFLIEGANLVEGEMTHLVNENIILVQVDKEVQKKRMAKRGLSGKQIERRFGFQFGNKERTEAITARQRKEFGRLFIKIDGSKETNIKEVYKKLQEEYERRYKIVREI
ncbi:dephospho-CoA kinase [Candidatus Parcubacteria bacterium]|nr:dephospho-CoA kinase [Candidatus Parcubacteria bacterium]